MKGYKAKESAEMPIADIAALCDPKPAELTSLPATQPHDPLAPGDDGVGGESNDDGTNVDDDSLPAAKRKLAPSRVKAKAAYEWALSKIPGAESMTIAELYDAIECHPSNAHEAIGPNSEAFGRYLRDAGIKRNNPRSGREQRGSITHRDGI